MHTLLATCTARRGGVQGWVPDGRATGLCSGEPCRRPACSHPLSCSLSSGPAGLLYTSAPRGELGGTAEFVDAQHGLSAEVRFGRLEGAGSGVLARSDAFSGTLWRAAPPADGLDRADSSASAGGWQAPALIERSKRSSGGLASGFSMSSIVRR